jgi:hypothetical protein
MFAKIAEVTAVPPPLRRLFVDGRGRVEADLLAFGSGAPLDPAGVADLLAWGYPTGSRSLLAGVTWQVPTWQLPPPDPHPSRLGPDARADALWELLVEAVDEAMAGVERVGVALSGGLDSRAVAAAALSRRPQSLLATFGDPGVPDLARARLVARRLGGRHLVSVLPLDCALLTEARVWEATGGLGGPASAPGAFTDPSWAGDMDVLLSGMSGDVLWGDTGLKGPSPPSRLRKLGVAAPGDPYRGVPEPPPWTTPCSAVAWRNLWTRQARSTWNGLLPRMPLTPVRPVLWSDRLVSFCLALDAVDRADRRLLRAMLTRHARAVDPGVVPPVGGPVHDLDRAMATSAGWRAALDAMIAAPQVWETLELRPRAVGRLLRLVRNGARPRAGLVSRLRVLWRWAERGSATRRER